MAIQSNFPAIKPTLLLDFANAEQLDPRIIFARASTATYYGTQTAKAEENLLVQSQDFTTTWINVNSTDAANTSTAPDGTTTADTLTDDATSGTHSTYQSVSVLANTTYVVSCFMKAGTNNFGLLSFTDAGSAQRYFAADFNLSTGTVRTSAAGSSGTITSATITDAGNGWYRCVIIGQAAAVGSNRIYVGVSDGTSSLGNFGINSYIGTGTTIIVWGAQLEQRSAVTAYTPTTTQPITNYIPQLLTAASGVARFDHNPTTFESLGLEIEEQRTNLALYSEDLSNAAWTFGNATLSSNTAISPGGTQTADQLVTSNSSGNTFARENVTLSAGSATLSVYLKTGGVQFAQFMWAGVFNGTDYANFDLVNGTVTAGTYTAATITPVGNGWYRCTLTSTVTASAGNFIYINAVPTSTSTRFASYTGNGWNSLYIWGAQLEAGAFATSYIPTVASQVTRSADAASMTGANFSSWYNAGEGSLYAEANTPAFATTYVFAEINNNSTSNYIRHSTTSAGTTTQFVVVNNTTTTASPSVTVTLGSNRKMAGAYAFNSIQQSVNGSLGTEDTSSEIPTGLVQMNIGSRAAGTSVVNGTIKKIAYYPLRVTNAQLQALTS
jgi:hypothetical protein